MILQPARVLAVEADRVRLSVDPPAGCKPCLAGRGCGGGLFTRLLPGRAVEITLPLPDGFDAAAPVALALEERALGRQAVGVYAGAVAAFIGAVALTTAAPVVSGDLPALAAGLGAMAAWFTGAHRRASRHPLHPRLVNMNPSDGHGPRSGARG